MPNWCRGNIRFRGKKEDILKFLEETIKFCTYNHSDKGPGLGMTVQKPAIITVEGYFDEVILTAPFENKEASWCYLGETNRNFLSLYWKDKGGIIVSATTYVNKDESECILVFDDFYAAWGIEAEPYVEMSKKYNIDIKILGWEQGLGFDEILEIIKGKIVKFGALHPGDLDYGQWVWETEMPYLGG